MQERHLVARARPGAAFVDQPDTTASSVTSAPVRSSSLRGMVPAGTRFARKCVSAALPAGAQISTAASLSAAPVGCRNADVGQLPSDGFARARRQPEQSGQAVRRGATIRDGDRDVVDSLHLDRWSGRWTTRLRGNYLDLEDSR